MQLALGGVNSRPVEERQIRRLQRRSSASVTTTAAAASQNGQMRKETAIRIPKRSFVHPHGIRQREVDKTALLTYIDEENNAAILAWILSRGLVDVGEHTNFGKPLLYEAVEKGQAPCVQLLLDRGIGDATIDYYGWNSLMCAASMGRDREVELLVSASKEHLSAEKYQAYVDKRAGERGGDVAGDTALHMAARAGFATGVMLLLTAGASPARTNSEGKKPAEIAKTAVVRTLIERAEGGSV